MRPHTPFTRLHPPRLRKTARVELGTESGAKRFRCTTPGGTSERRLQPTSLFFKGQMEDVRASAPRVHSTCRPSQLSPPGPRSEEPVHSSEEPVYCEYANALTELMDPVANSQGGLGQPRRTNRSPKPRAIHLHASQWVTTRRHFHELLIWTAASFDMFRSAWNPKLTPEDAHARGPCEGTPNQDPVSRRHRDSQPAAKATAWTPARRPKPPGSPEPKLQAWYRLVLRRD